MEKNNNKKGKSKDRKGAKKGDMSGEKYGVKRIITEERELNSQELEKFEDVPNARPAAAHLRNRKLKWKNSATGSEEETTRATALSSPHIIVFLLVIGLLTLYYLNRKLRR
ncbi:hypothetical protein RB195_007990 [Necator americanus]|uniref:Uncharacterized protein n=1 Tax=Necator americanus TaxID=51031 RepID=A0ABR1C1E3_NECAM